MYFLICGFDEFVESDDAESEFEATLLELYACVYVCVCVCSIQQMTYMHTYKYTCTCTYTYTYAHTYAHKVLARYVIGFLDIIS
jgi:hypothetical protein